MKFLILSQVFWPDTVSTAQHLSDVAFKLAQQHEVTVFTSRHNYENPTIHYPLKQTINGVSIVRFNNTSFGKGHILYRLLDFFSFNFVLMFKLMKIKRSEVDVILGMTSPPFVSFIGVFFAKRKKVPFYYWTMDLQPELSIASGLLRKNSLLAGMFQRMGNYIFKNASHVIVLDRYMRNYVIGRGAPEEKVSVLPVWPVVEQIYEGKRSDNKFRIANDFQDKIVVMYSGNHSYIHPLDTLLDAAFFLKSDPRFLFVFIGGGVRKKDVSEFKRKHHLDSIIQLDYQPRESIHLSLGSADLQVVIMGDNQVGFTHPNKVYGSMFIGKPILYIGPPNSHITDILGPESGNIAVSHGQASELAKALLDFARKDTSDQDMIGARNKVIAHEKFHPDVLTEKICNLMTNP